MEDMLITFDILSEDHLRGIASFSLNSTYDLADPRFGVTIDCEVCGKNRCDGHYAVLDLGTYIIHPTFVKNVVNRIRRMCLKCGNKIPLKRSKNYKCGDCGSVINKDIPSMDDIRSLGNLRSLFQQRGLREKDFIIRNILVPPPGVRPRNDVEWPSDLSQAYTLLTEAVRKYRKDKSSLEYRNSISRYYSKIATGGKGSVIDRLISGKNGVFREIVKGKRLDSSFRSVITGDPNIGVDEIMIPRTVANKISIRERCFSHNVTFLKEMAKNGLVFWDEKGDNVDPENIIEGFEYYRLIRDGDLVLFNRQPSLSRDSIMSFRTRIRKDNNLTISMNPIVTTPFNADFDGDEMNIFANWSLESQAELESLCNVNLSASVRPIQDTITGAYMLTRDNVIINEELAMDCATLLQVGFVRDATGIDMFNLCLPYDMEINFPVTKDVICKTIPRDIMRVTGSNRDVIVFYERLQQLVCLWSRESGFSTSIHDCVLREEDIEERDHQMMLIEEDDDLYMASQRRFSEWTYQKCLGGYDNTPICSMIKSGSKGNIINMSQIMASVGHQYIDYDYGSKKVGNIMDKNFIRSSYIEGLNSEEFILHLVASRRGVIDTGVSTSSTGYLSRRLSMMLCNCHLDYMGTVIEGKRIISFLDTSKSKYF